MKNYLHFISMMSLVLIIPLIGGQNAKLTAGELDENNHVLSLSSDVEDLVNHPNQYFVQLCAGLSQAEVNATLADLNSIEIWNNRKTGLRLWAVKKLPYTCKDGEIIDIDKNVKRAKDKSEISEATVDQVYLMSSNFHGNGNNNFDHLDLYESPGSTKVKISILDSGISDQAMAFNNASDYVFGPAKYTGYDYINDDPIPDDENGHGTYIAGIIYNILNHEDNAPNVSFDIRKTHGPDGRGNISDLVAATIDAVDAGADIINMSFSYIDVVDMESFSPLGVAVEYARQNGVLIVTSAGNNSNDNDFGDTAPFPATLTNENILTVASNNELEDLSFFSNYGNYSVDVSILGENIPAPGPDGNLEYVSGTSFSTAIVTGLSAVLGTRQDIFNSCEIKCILINTSKAVPGFIDLNVSGGVINFKKAINNPPSSCSTACPDIEPGTIVVGCGEYCPPETTEQNICVEKNEIISSQLSGFDPDGDPVIFSTAPVYGPFKGNLTINPDGSFTYKSKDGKPDMFVYQVCNGKVSKKIYGTASGMDCKKETDGNPRILTLRYIGGDCYSSSHTQDDNKVKCSGDPQNASLVYVTVLSEDKSDRVLLSRRKVTLNESFIVDAATINKPKLEKDIVIYLENEQGQQLQFIKFHTSGSQPLVIGDRFGSIELVGLESEKGDVCPGSEEYCTDGCSQGVVYVNGMNCYTNGGLPDGVQLVSSQIAASLDDAEERRSDGSMYRYSSDLELIDDSDYKGPQVVGMRFRNITVPQGAVIESAVIRFYAKYDESGATSIVFRGHDTDNAPGFSTNYRNISSRPGTTASTSWSNIPAWSTNDIYPSPDMSNIIQEIVDRDGWVSGNSVVITVTGSGERTAWSYEEHSDRAPILEITYSEGGTDEDVCPPQDDCGCDTQRQAIGLMYVGSEPANITGSLKSGGGEAIGTYQNVNSGDLIVFSSLYRDKDFLKGLYLQSDDGSPEIEISVYCSTSIMDNTYGNFKVVYQADMLGNVCSIPYSSCQEVIKNCEDHEVLAAVVEQAPDQTVTLDLEQSEIRDLIREQPAEQRLTVKDVNLYPNPARNAVYINLKDFSGQAVDIAIYDSVSRLIKRVQLNEVNGAPVEIMLDNFSNGLYTVAIRSEGEQPVLKKLVINKP